MGAFEGPARERGGPSNRGEALVGVAAIGLPSVSADRGVGAAGVTGVGVTRFSITSFDNLFASDCVGVGVDDDGRGGSGGDGGGGGGGSVEGGGGTSARAGVGAGATMVHLFRRSAPSSSRDTAAISPEPPNPLHFPPCIPVPAVELCPGLNRLLDPFLPDDNFARRGTRSSRRAVVRDVTDIRSLGVSRRAPREMRYEIICLPKASCVENRDVLGSGTGNANDQVFGRSIFCRRMDDEVGHKRV
jgi:hypothetical protein